MNLQAMDIEPDCTSLNLDNYNLPLRIGSVFIVLIASAFAVFLPLVIQRLLKSGDKSSTAEWILVLVKQFGAGVIVATAFIHLLPDAFETFSNPCIGELSFDAWPGALAMIGVLMTFTIENIGHRIVSERIKHAKARLAKDAASAPLLPTTTEDSIERPQPKHLSSHSHSHHSNGQGIFGHSETHVHSHGHTFFELDRTDDNVTVTKDLSESIERLSLYVLEAGIMFHSVLIGVTLSVTQASAWPSLFVVIIFHQMFEGMALGTRIIDVKSLSRTRKYSLCIGFCTITPIGMAIGILARSNYAGDSSPTALWAMGTLNSLSAGILLWVSLVELLAEEWMHGDLHEASAPMSLLGFFAVALGAALMSLLGKWV
ncbi:Zinc/iron permease [Lipomyces kononenkoae]|uniref:Zinc/iron permease n=1 Tax=Lipomyces kononenkoae TaxID=34357 RepID=A0ACC3SW82_LIPKO